MKGRTKRLLAGTSAAALLAASVVGGSLAYFTDTDEDVNVMTMGNVDIAQHEYERVVDENGDFAIIDTSAVEPNYGYEQAYELQEFTPGKPALPAVYANGATAWDESQQLWNQVGAPGSNDLFDDSMKNVIDKFVFVENTGKTDAYYRTIIAIETPEELEEGTIHLNFNSNSRFDAIEESDDFTGEADKGKKSYKVGYITIDGVRYGLYNMTYNQVLEPGEVSRPSLLQVFLDPETTNEDAALFGDTWDILVLSQAVQAAGFSDAGDALDEAFGSPTGTNDEGVGNAEAWLSELTVPTLASSLDELESAIENAEAGDEILLTSDVTLAETLAVPSGVTLSLDGVKINGTVKALGDLTINGDAYIKTLTAVNGGTIAVEEGKKLELNNFSFGSKDSASSEYVITGGTVAANYGFFQHGAYELHSDFETGYMYYSYGSDITVYGTFHSKGTGDGLDYVRGKLTIADGGKSIHDQSLWVGQPETWGAMSATLIVEDGGYVQAKSLSVYPGSALQIDATNMQAGEVGAVVCNKISNTGTVEAINNDALTASVENNKIVVTAK